MRSGCSICIRWDCCKDRFDPTRPFARFAALRIPIVSAYGQNTWLCPMRRHRESLAQAASACIPMMQKALTQMNLQLHNVISDITGASGMRILQAIVAGERDGESLASLCDPNIRASREVVRQSLEGNYRPEFLFIIRQSLEQYRGLQRLVGECEQETAKLLDEAPGKVEIAEKPLPPPRSRVKRRATMP